MYNAAVQSKVGIETPTSTEGGSDKIKISDDEIRGLLIDIVRELKKMNIHLSVLTDMVVKNQDVET